MKLPARPYSIASLMKGLESTRDASWEVNLGELMADHSNPDSPQPPMRLGSRSALLPTAGFARALGAESAAAGADLVVASVARVAAAARPQLALDVAGVPRQEVMGTGPLSLPAWEPEATPGGWLAEGGLATENQLTVRSVDAIPHSSYAYLDISRRLQKAVPMIEADVLAELGRAVAAVLEDGFINGDNTGNRPLGLLQLPGATHNANSWAGATPTRAELITQIQNYSEAHGRLDQARWILNSDLAARMLAQEVSSGSGQFIMQLDPIGRPVCMGIPMVLCEAMPDDRLLLINPQSLRIIYWGAPAALIDPYTFDTSGTKRLLVYNDADIVSLYPAQVCIGGAA